MRPIRAVLSSGELATSTAVLTNSGLFYGIDLINTAATAYTAKVYDDGATGDVGTARLLAVLSIPATANSSDHVNLLDPVPVARGVTVILSAGGTGIFVARYASLDKPSLR